LIEPKKSKGGWGIAKKASTVVPNITFPTATNKASRQPRLQGLGLTSLVQEKLEQQATQGAVPEAGFVSENGKVDLALTLLTL